MDEQAQRRIMQQFVNLRQDRVLQLMLHRTWAVSKMGTDDATPGNEAVGSSSEIGWYERKERRRLGGKTAVKLLAGILLLTSCSSQHEGFASNNAMGMQIIGLSPSITWLNS